jgi:lipoprotein NlpD
MPATAPVSTPKYGATAQVQRGDTLYGIAFRNGIDVRDLAEWNSLSAPYTIYPG